MTQTTIPKIKLPHGNWKPRPHQKKLWRFLGKGGKRAIEIAHRRWGKDEIALHNTACAIQERPASYWHCLPEYAQARKAIWTSINAHTGKRRIDEVFPKLMRLSTNESEMFIRFKNGATWQVIGSDRYDTLVGAGVAGVVFSEWSLANPSSWGYIRPMVEENNGWALFITTPRGRNHAKAMFDMALKNDRWFAEISTIEDTRALDGDQLQESLAEYIAIYGADIGKAQFEQEYYCNWNAAVLGAFYAIEMAAVRSSGRVRDEVVPIEGVPIHTAWDLGVRDSTAIFWWQGVGRRLIVLDYYAAHGAGVEHYADVCRNRGWSRKGTIDYMPHDARVREWGTGKTRIEQAFDLGLKPAIVERSTDADGHQAIRSTLPHAVFHTRCEDGLSALEMYRREWDDELKTFKAAALHDWASHGAKAFQYLSQAWRATDPLPEPPPKPLYKPLPEMSHDEYFELHDRLREHRDERI